MANTTKLTDVMLQIKGLDEDWSLPGDLAGFAETGIMVKAIKFKPSDTDDVMVIKAGKGSQATEAEAIATTATAPELFACKCADAYDQRVEYYGDEGKRMWPFIDISDCTLGTAANARVEFELA